MKIFKLRCLEGAGWVKIFFQKMLILPFEVPNLASATSLFIDWTIFPFLAHYEVAEVWWYIFLCSNELSFQWMEFLKKSYQIRMLDKYKFEALFTTLVCYKQHIWNMPVSVRYWKIKMCPYHLKKCICPQNKQVFMLFDEMIVQVYKYSRWPKLTAMSILCFQKLLLKY